MIFKKKSANFCQDCGKPLTKHDNKNICERCHNKRVSKTKKNGSILFGTFTLVMGSIPIIKHFCKKR